MTCSSLLDDINKMTHGTAFGCQETAWCQWRCRKAQHIIVHRCLTDCSAWGLGISIYNMPLLLSSISTWQHNFAGWREQQAQQCSRNPGKDMLSLIMPQLACSGPIYISKWVMRTAEGLVPNELVMSCWLHHESVLITHAVWQHAQGRS